MVTLNEQIEVKTKPRIASNTYYTTQPKVLQATLKENPEADITHLLCTRDEWLQYISSKAGIVLKDISC